MGFNFRTLSHIVQVDAMLNGNKARLGVGMSWNHWSEILVANSESLNSYKMYSSISKGRSLIFPMIEHKVSAPRRF